MCPTSMRRSPGRRAAPAPVTARWKSAPYGPCKSRPMFDEGNRNAREIAEAVARQSYGKLVAFLSAQTRDVARAEDALSEAFAAALADWPQRGVPERPEAWLM